jgi:CO dehydrogenase maturation factor
MKIAVSGKGGTGKTFIAGVLSFFFVQKGFKVLAIDADPSPNLALTLGIPWSDASKIVPISENRKLIESKTNTGFNGVYRLSFTVDDVVKDYGVRSPYGVDLLVMGTVRSAGTGCTCPANALIRALLQHLVVERNEVVIMDMEAGVEHFGRGTARHMDMLVTVMDSSMKSMEIAKRIEVLAKEIEIKRVFVVGNKLTNASQDRLMRKFATDNDLDLLDLIPFDEHIMKSDMVGETPLRRIKNSKGIAAIMRIGERLLEYKS